MSDSSTYRGFKRRIGQMARRVQSGPGIKASQLSSEVMDLLRDLRRSAEREREVAVELALSLLETLPQLFLYLDDRLGLLERALDEVPRLLSDLMLDDNNEDLPVIDRPEVLERLFCLWVGDDSGYLKCLNECLLECASSREDEECLLVICDEHLRHTPLVFPAVGGQKMDIDRSILQADRHRVEFLLGEVYARRGVCEYSVIVARSHYRVTGDACDLINMLVRAGREDDAVDIASRVLRRPEVPRRSELERIYEGLLAKRKSDVEDKDASRDHFLANPSLEAFEELEAITEEKDWPVLRDSILDIMQGEGMDLEFVLQQRILSGNISEADGLVVTQPINAKVLAGLSLDLLDEHPEKAAGWLIIAAHRHVRTARRTNYEKAASWLATVKLVSDQIGQSESFQRAMAMFRDTYARRSALLKVLDDQAL